MPDARYPTLEEFWRRARGRGVEPDLVRALEERASADGASLQRLRPEATVVAVVDRLLPGSAVPPRAIAAFVDAHYDRQLGRGDERTGTLPRERLIPLGFEVLEGAAGRPFAELPAEEQDRLLAQAEAGDVTGPEGFDSRLWFQRLRDLVLLAFGSDPRGMVQMGYPGPSFQPGHLWLGPDEVAARAARRRGYEEF